MNYKKTIFEWIENNIKKFFKTSSFSEMKSEFERQKLFKQVQ